MGNLKADTWLDREDSGCREGRLSRLNWLAALVPEAEGWLFPGGFLAKYLFEEARYCYVYGQFLGATLLGMAYIEHTLAALFYASGRSDLERSSISILLREAAAQGWLRQDELQALDRARNLRNRISHFRQPVHAESLEYQSATQGEIPYSIVEEDARYIMQAVFRLLARNAA